MISNLKHCTTVAFRTTRKHTRAKRGVAKQRTPRQRGFKRADNVDRTRQRGQQNRQSLDNAPKGQRALDRFGAAKEQHTKRRKGHKGRGQEEDNRTTEGHKGAQGTAKDCGQCLFPTRQ